ncbi:hypothetical protein [Streptomyces sp. KR80]|uniref:hypothetical protein n=1 Tax=Streptomyces sp. KR80 TaxID=3457426 RepID=UPI003FD0F74D
MSPTSMARWARHHQIPTRRGGASHNPALRALADGIAAPRLLRPALHRRGGREHLLNFAAAASHPTLGVAAQALKIKQFTSSGRSVASNETSAGHCWNEQSAGVPCASHHSGRERRE